MPVNNWRAMFLPAAPISLHSLKQFLLKIQERTTTAPAASAILHNHEVLVFDQLPVEFQNCFWISQRGPELTR
jgi:hypothetical protein